MYKERLMKLLFSDQQFSFKDEDREKLKHITSLYGPYNPYHYIKEEDIDQYNTEYKEYGLSISKDTSAFKNDTDIKK